METINFKNLIDEIGNTVHSLNTIVVSISIMPDAAIDVPKDLDISWKPQNIELSKIRARSFAKRSAYVYVAENLFEYLGKISSNPLWKYPSIHFNGKEKKALRVYNFLKSIPGLEHESIILCELLCHWRNKVVHEATSNADLSSNKKDVLIAKRDELKESLHNFDTEVAISNFQSKKATLKDVSTMTTLVIKCCRAVDEYYFNGIADVVDFTEYKELFVANDDFKNIYRQSPSEKRSRQIERWIRLNYGYMEEGKIYTLIDTLTN